MDLQNERRQQLSHGRGCDFQLKSLDEEKKRRIRGVWNPNSLLPFRSSHTDEQEEEGEEVCM